MAFDTIVAPTISELFENKLQDMILSGELKAGDKLPTEQELADKMRISKSSVHAGLKELERKGFLRVVPRRGVYVANYTETGNLETLVALLKRSGNMLDHQTVTSLFQFRDSIEGTAVRLLAANHTDDHILRMRFYIDDLRKAYARTPPASINELAQILFDYHLYIALRSGNNVIPMVMNGFYDISIVFWRSWIQSEGQDTVISFLNRFTDYIAAGDADAAMALYRENAKRFLDKHYLG